MRRNLPGTSSRLQGLVDSGLEVVLDCEEGSKMDVELGDDRSISEELENLEETRKRERTESGVVRWEEYMPKMVIRVLLVEADDSTRQIIAALLRKCNYKVAAIPDGLTAWEILKQRHSNIDLILTEVDLPAISGYALLTLIMEHDGCKKIPVIMMSSCDSMTTVFKCMLKGAADFLIKPVRKNELKNLWQHVWRRISNNNGQGQQSSRSGHCNIKETSKSSEEGRSHYSDEDASSSLKFSHSAANKANDDAQMVLEQAEISALRNGHWEKNTSSNSMTTRDETDVIAVASERHVIPMRQGIVDGCRTEDKNLEPESSIAAAADHGKKQEHAIEAVDLIGKIDDHADCNSFYRNSELHNNAIPELELSLRRAEDQEEEPACTSLKKRKLNHSNISAFARYTSGKHREPFEISNDDARVGDAHTFQLFSLNGNAALSSEENHRAPCSENYSDLREDVTQMHPVSLPVCEVGSIYPPMMSQSQAAAAAHTRQKESSSSLLTSSPTRLLHSDMAEGSLIDQSGETTNQEHNTTGKSGEDQHQPRQQQEEQHQQVIYAAAKQMGDDCQKIINGNNSAVCSGSSDGLTNKSSTITAITTTTTEDDLVNDNGTTASTNMVMDDGGVHQPSRGKTPFFSLQREAALAKFRQKRKDRCFEKKVRYQSRKRLAEQRPRVKGQFVRQVVNNDQPNGDNADSHD